MLGWGGLALPERLGGSGQSLANAVIVAIEVGRRASPLPLAPTIWPAWLSPRRRPRNSQRPSFGGRDHSERPCGRCLGRRRAGRGGNTMKTHAVSTPDGWVLTGTKSPIEHALAADSLIVSADVDGTTELFIVPRNAAAPKSGSSARSICPGSGAGSAWTTRCCRPKHVSTPPRSTCSAFAQRPPSSQARTPWGQRLPC